MGALGVLRAWAGAERNRRGRSRSSTGPTRRAPASAAACSGVRRWPGPSTRRSSRTHGTPTAGVRREFWPRTASISSASLESGSRLDGLGAYLELHIEQGPVLEAEGISAAAVSGCVGVERLRFASPAASRTPGRRRWTPRQRRGPGRRGRGAASRARSPVAEGGVGTVGEIALRAGDPDGGPRPRLAGGRPAQPQTRSALARMLEATREAVAACAAGAGLRASTRSRSGGSSRSPSTRSLWRSPARRASAWPATAYELSSGALHDAASMAPAPADRNGLLPLDRRGQPRPRGGHLGIGLAHRD